MARFPKHGRLCQVVVRGNELGHSYRIRSQRASDLTLPIRKLYPLFNGAVGVLSDGQNKAPAGSTCVVLFVDFIGVLWWARQGSNL
jgi:hypothetical protein